MLPSLMKPAAGPGAGSSPLLIVDTDGGCDDAMALLALCAYLKGRNEMDRLLGVTCVWGNTGLENVVRNVEVCRQIAGAEFGVYAGCSMAMTGRPYGDGYFGEDGLRGQQQAYLKSAPAVSALHAADFLAAQLQAHPQQVTLVMIGPLTNLALALAKNPSLAGLLGRLVLLGGSYLGVGLVEDCPNAEFNFHCDGCATELVFRLVPRPLVVPLEACLHATESSPLPDLFDCQDTLACRFLHDIFKGTDKLIADPLAVLVAVDPDSV
jgi:purine nucleosidase